MSTQRFVEAPADLQIWDNAAFDNGDCLSHSWGSLKSIFENGRASTESVSGKENQSPGVENRMRPVVSGDGESKIRIVLGKKFEENPFLKPVDVNRIKDEITLDEEIQEIESEILRLSSRLKALKLEKAEMRVKTGEKRVSPAKPADRKLRFKPPEEFPKVSSNRKQDVGRGVSLGPAEIGRRRRGISMDPSEILSTMKSRQEMITPSQDRRKSCFFNLLDIDEEKVVPATGRVTKSHVAVPRQAVSTITARRSVKKDDGLLSTIQPKKLFGEKSVPAASKKPGRVVASRYNQSTTASAMKKRSLTENNSKRCEKKRSLSAEKSRGTVTDTSNIGASNRTKKKWEIPSEIVLHDSSLQEEKSPSSLITAIPNLLPKLRVAQCLKDSPRDSGPAKRVAELVGRKSVFATDDGEGASVCQALTYVEEDDEMEEK